LGQINSWTAHDCTMTMLLEAPNAFCTFSHKFAAPTGLLYKLYMLATYQVETNLSIQTMEASI
jgi:hypothetical protein